MKNCLTCRPSSIACPYHCPKPIIAILPAKHRNKVMRLRRGRRNATKVRVKGKE